MPRKRILVIAVVVVIAAVVLFNHFHSAKPPAEEQKAAAVVTVTRGPLTSRLAIAGQFIPYQVVDLHAKVAGYIRSIKVDIGDLVHNGEVLAVLEVPELQDQYLGSQAEVKHAESEVGRAQSEVVSAKATYFGLHLDYQRLSEASKQRPGLIAQQEVDDAQAKDQQAEAQIGVAQASVLAAQQALGVAQANMHRYQTLTGYEQIVAPYTGVVTMRYGNVGSLIQAGQESNSAAMPVVQVSQSDLLRLRIPVPESDVQYIKIGGDIDVKVDAVGHTFVGKVVRFTRALDPNTRTMLTEVDVPNPDLVLSPGMYAETNIQLQHKDSTLIVPSQAIVLEGQQAYVLAVDGDNKIVRRNVTVGIQTANNDEVLTGLQEGDKVIASGQSNYEIGETVKPHQAYVPTTAQEESE